MLKSTYMSRLTTVCLLGLSMLSAGAGALAQSTGTHERVHSDIVIEGTGDRPPQGKIGPDVAQDLRSSGISTTPDNQILLELKPEDTVPPNLFDLDGRTLIFRPDGRGGYSRDVRSLEWEDTLGTDVTLEWERHRDGVEVEFGDFEFDYAGRRWNSVFMSKHGLLTFGAPIEYSKHFAAWFSPMSESAARLATTPTISALYKPAFGGLYGRDPLAAQFVARFPDRVVVTWFASEYDAYRLEVPDDAERFQAVLYADGAIQLNYGHITVRDGVVGLFSDVVEKGNSIASIADPTDSELPGHLDLLDVAIYESNTDSLIVEWTMRDGVPAPPSGTTYSYRLYFDTDQPYFDGDDDIEFMWSVDVATDDSWARGGTRLPTSDANRIALLVDDASTRGVTAGIKPDAAQFDDGRFVQGNWKSRSTRITLPDAPPTTDLSRSDRNSSGRLSEVFHYRSEPDAESIACRIIENLGDRFDLFVFHNEFRVDFQMNDSDWRNYYNGVKGIGREDKWRRAPCGEGRLLGHYEQVVRIGQAGGRIHDWENGNFNADLILFAHEFTHSWTAFMSYVESDGMRDRLFADSFADGCRCHWRGELHAPAAFPWGGEKARSLMMGGEGGGFWRDNGDGTFTAITDLWNASGLSWLDLYAMGLAEASEVPDLFVLRNLEPVAGNEDPRSSGQYWGTFHADKETISIEQIVAVEGPREPPAARSRKEFNAGFVYLLEPGQTPTPELLQLHRVYIDRVVDYWLHVTGGRSRITTTLPGVANRAPVAVGTLADQALDLDDQAVVDVRRAFRDPDGDRLTYDATSSAPGVASVAVSGNLLTATPLGVGTATVTVMATDAGGSNRTATQRFVVTVTVPANRPPEPVGVLAPLTLGVDEAPVTVEVSGAFQDPDGDALTYGATSSAPAVAAVDVSRSTVTVTAVAPAGTATVTVTATDPGGLSAIQTFAVTVGGRTPRSALVEIYDATGGARWTTRTNWLSDQPIGRWHGVETDDAGRVTGLKLQGNGLTGRVPDALRRLSFLQDLRLAGNHLTGPVPAWLATLPFLRELWLDSNGLSGTIPPELGTLTGLGHLSLDGNGGLTGPVPPEFGNLTTLWTLRLQHTALTGPLPLTMTNLRSLDYLDVRNTGLCAPQDPAFQSWLRTVSVINGGIVACRDPANRPPEPVGMLAPLTVRVGEAPVPVDVSGAFRDPDGDALTYAAASSAAAVAAVGVAGSTVTVTPLARGTATVTVAATDGGGSNGTATQTFEVTVGAKANTPPEAVGTLPPLTMTVGEPARPVDVAAAFRDADGDPLTYQATSSVPDVASVAASGSTLMVRPVATGAATISVTATDVGGSDTAATLAFRVTVREQIAFTDDPIVPGVTPVRAIHFTELREHIDILRAAAGLEPFSWTDPVLTAGVTRVRLVHLIEFRDALAAAYVASGRAAPTYTDAVPMSGTTPIRAAHLAELRAAVLAF